jgi:hypothetical protein
MSDEQEAVFSLGRELGVEGKAGAWRIALYFPDRDRAGNPVAIETYIRGCMRVLTDVNRGVTRLPYAIGTWLEEMPEGDDQAEREPVEENTTVVYSIIFDPDRFADMFKFIKRAFFLFGKDTNQGELFLEYSGELQERYFNHAYRIPRSIFELVEG